MDTVSIIHHMQLCKYLKKLKYISKIVTKHTSNSLRKSIFNKYWIFIWSLTTNFLLLFILFYDLKFDTITERTLFWYNSENVFFRYLCFLLYLLCTGIFFYMPFNTFIIYYTVLCYELKHMVYDYKVIMKTTFVNNYERFSEMYSRIRHRVKLIDSEVGIFVFLSFLFNTLMMYVIFSMITHISSSNYIDTKMFILKIIYCGISLANFSVLLFFASFVHDASMSVKDEVTDIKENNPQLISSYLSFILTHRADFCMTVWGIAGIKKSFVFGTFGTILTYCFLFDSMKAQEN